MRPDKFWNFEKFLEKIKFPIETYAKLTHIEFMEQTQNRHSKRRTITYLNIPTLAPQIAKVLHPELREYPIAIAPPRSDQSKVQAVCERARAEGIYKGMPVASAKRLCSGLKIVSPEPDVLKRVHRKLVEKVSKTVELYEVEAPGKIYLDLSGFHQIYGPAKDFAREFQKEINQNLSLFSSLGLAKNKLVSKIAAKSIANQREIQQIVSGQEKHFLSPFSYLYLPVSRALQEKTRHQIGNIFEDLNIQTIHDLRGLSKTHLLVAFKEKADLIFQMSRGVDSRPLLLPKTEIIIAKEMYLQEETNSLSLINSYLMELLDHACFELRLQNKWAQELKVLIRYSDYKLVEAKKKLSSPSRLAQEMEKTLSLLLRQAFYRRTNIRYLAVELKDLVFQYQQLSFFDTLDGEQSTLDNQNLSNSMDTIRKKFGFNSIKFGK